MRRNSPAPPSTVITTSKDTSTTTTSRRNPPVYSSTSSPLTRRFLLSPPPAARSSSSHQQPPPTPTFSYSWAEALRKLGGASSPRSKTDAVVNTTDILGPSSPTRKRWIVGPNGEIVETPPTGTRGGLFATTSTTTTYSPHNNNNNNNTSNHDKYRDDTATAAAATADEEGHNGLYTFYDASRGDSGTHLPSTSSFPPTLPPTLPPPTQNLPPLTNGVPSRGSLARTQGHYPYSYPSSSSSCTKEWPLPPTYFNSTHNKMSSSNATAPVVDKEKHGDHLRDEETSSSEVGTVTTSKRGKVKRHCAKWWWVHLLVFIALVVLIVCLM